MQSIPIILSSDNNYAPFAAVLITSVCHNTKSFCNFYILDGGITKENKEKILELKNQFNNFSLDFVQVDENKIGLKDFILNSYITKATYYRFMIPKIFCDIKKLLYLDSDMIVKKDITELYLKNIDSYFLGAVKDYGSTKYINKLKNNLEIDKSHNYFNAGVLLLNNQKWIKENIFEKLLKIKEKYKTKLLCNDQDVLNKCFENNYFSLDYKYNSLTNDTNTLIRHYYGPIKPWQISPSLCEGEYEEFKIFWFYASKTSFYDYLKDNCKYKTIHILQLLRLYKKQS